MEEFNHERPHEALAMKCPAEIYSDSCRPYRGIPEPTTPSTSARSQSPAADVFVCTTRRSISASPLPAKPSGSKKSTTASGWLVLWITISAISIWRKNFAAAREPLRAESVTYVSGPFCYLCLRNGQNVSGGARSLALTLLRPPFPANRENNREFSVFLSKIGLLVL
jgi:hypothetical protein